MAKHAKKTKRKKAKTSPRRTARKRTIARRVRRRIRHRKTQPRRVVRTRLRTRKRIVRTPKRKPPRRKKRKPPIPPQAIEYQVNVSYRNKAKPGGAISLQFSVIGPPNLTKDQVIDAITDTIESKGDAPRGFKVRIVSWKGGTVPRSVPWGSLSIIAGEPATRFSVQ